MTSRRRTIGLVLAAGIAAAGAFGAGGPVNASTPDDVLRVSLRGGAAIQSGGAGVVVTVKVRCKAGTPASLTLQVTQSHAGGELTASSGGATTFTCTGPGQLIRMPVIAIDPESSQELVAPFEPGSAFVSAELGACPESCSFEADARTVDLHSRRINEPEIVDPVATMSLPADASLEADGAGVVVIVPYTCVAGFFGSFQALLAQVVAPGAVANGFDTLPITCTGSQRDGVLSFHAELSAWTRGPAFITLRGEGCAPDGCVEGLAFRTLRVA